MLNAEMREEVRYEHDNVYFASVHMKTVGDGEPTLYRRVLRLNCVLV